MNKRTTRDFVNEMNNEAKILSLVCIVVGFEMHSDFVWNIDNNPHEKLDALLAQGGQPVGPIGIRNSGNGTEILMRPFEEYRDKAWVEDYLENLGKAISASASSSGYKSVPWKPENN